MWKEKMSTIDLKFVLDEHRKWLESNFEGKRADLSGADLHGADLHGADLHGADLHDTNLYGADLHDTNLYGADLHDADLRDADLYGADLYGTDLRDTNLYGADLHDADLHGANLSGADLHGANLHGADLHDTNLRDADLSAAKCIPKIYQSSLSLLKHQKGTLIAFKYLNGMTTPYKGMELEIGKGFEVDDFSTDERILCAKGLSVATLDWCLRDTNCDLTKTYIEVEFTAKDIIAIPYNTDGKLRVRKLKVIRELTRGELMEYIQPLYPSVEERQEKC